MKEYSAVLFVGEEIIDVKVDECKSYPEDHYLNQNLPELAYSHDRVR